MDNITTVVGKLLYFARSMCQKKQITPAQLATLKDMILADNEDVMAAYQEYNNNGTELTLSSTLIRLVHQEKDSESDGGQSRSSSKRNRKNSIKIVIPKRNIQKMPAGMGRI